jgi:hypothetical protein
MILKQQLQNRVEACVKDENPKQMVGYTFWRMPMQNS